MAKSDLEKIKNEEYIASLGIPPDHENYQVLLTALNGYGENRWWLSDDPRERAYYQTFEPIQCVLIAQYNQDLAALLGRHVHEIEFLAPDALKKEVERAWKYGVVLSQEQQQDSLRNALQALCAMADQQGISVVMAVYEDFEHSTQSC